VSHDVIEPDRKPENVKSVVFEGLNILRRDLARGLPPIEREPYRKPLLKRNIFHLHTSMDTCRVLRQRKLLKSNIRIHLPLGRHIGYLHD
jgi:hypothetical protein